MKIILDKHFSLSLSKLDWSTPSSLFPSLDTLWSSFSLPVLLLAAANGGVGSVSDRGQFCGSVSRPGSAGLRLASLDLLQL